MKREDVEERLKWAVEDIFASDDLWEKKYDSVMEELDFSKYAGSLADREKLHEFLKLSEEVEFDAERLAIYANMRHDEDTANSKYTAYDSKMGMLFSKFATETAFYEPEMASMDEKYLRSLYEDESFSDYDYQIKRLIDRKLHVLPVEQERLIASGNEIFSSFYDIFGMIDNADLPLPDMKVNGEDVRITHGNYGLLIKDPDRETRREAYEKYYATYDGLLNTITATYYGNVKTDVFLARAYKFDSCLKMALFNEDVDAKVYENLLSSVERGFPAMHRYVSDRKKILGYDKLYFYDMYVPLVEDAEIKLGYDEAYDLVIEGLSCLGEEYCGLLKKAHDERWIDVEETDNKRSGAYSTGCKGIHPYVLLNYKPDTSDVFTIAHEMGHSLHTYFTCESQPAAKSDYKIFVAEVASTVNEVLLLKYLYNRTEDVALKKYLLNYYLEMMRTTLFRQTMFAEFEYKAHDAVENGIPLTREYLSEIYADLGRRYYGDSVEHDYNISIEWARIPHFYRSFYVYKYATGITAAINIANRILTEGETAVEDYFSFLRSGCSSDPVSLLKLAGVDLGDRKPFEFAMAEFENTLSEFEKLSGIE